MANTNVNEAAVLSVTDDQEEEKLVAFIVPGDYPDTDRQSLKTELNDYIERRIGEYAIPESYVFSDELPRTRTGKLVRRLLRRIASGGMQTDEDLSHVANPNSVEKLISAKGPE
jgi:acetyl-CoA synthetase